MDVNKVAELARLKLDGDEVKKLEQELAAVLGYVGKLKEVNVDGVPELNHPLETVNALRADAVVKFPDEDAAALALAAPEHHEGYVKVRQIFNE
ncbi:MAG: Asp-tRNA(Asn)/Glu-tRNA(Gln) amidotransferase subunit GatC [Candidatus Niyogibacteria bacterium]|nr:Asp-tRNA(Asn)/Glu-tRNA(Gln) amidotransferase subunit GatC [Candidatus Niyogibacteria bacterium]